MNKTKTAAVAVMLGIISASAGVVVQDRVTELNFMDAARLNSMSFSSNPGWSLGSRPFGNINGSWVISQAPARKMRWNFLETAAPQISLEVPISLTLR